MSDKYLILDLDNTLLNYNAGFEAYMKQFGHERTEDDTYDLLAHYPSVECKDKMFKYVCQFNSSPEFAELYPNPYMVDWVKEMKRDGWKIVALSSFLPPYDSLTENICSIKSALYRHQNLERLFGQGFFESIIFKDLGESKYEVFSNYAMIAEQLIIVDDAEKYILEAWAAKEQYKFHIDVEVYVYDQLYNQHLGCDVRIDLQFFLEE